jgi:hypothetical protein
MAKCGNLSMACLKQIDSDFADINKNFEFVTKLHGKEHKIFSWLMAPNTKVNLFKSITKAEQVKKQVWLPMDDSIMHENQFILMCECFNGNEDDSKKVYGTMHTKRCLVPNESWVVRMYFAEKPDIDAPLKTESSLELRLTKLKLSTLYLRLPLDRVQPQLKTPNNDNNSSLIRNKLVSNVCEKGDSNRSSSFVLQELMTGRTTDPEYFVWASETKSDKINWKIVYLFQQLCEQVYLACSERSSENTEALWQPQPQVLYKFYNDHPFAVIHLEKFLYTNTAHSNDLPHSHNIPLAAWGTIGSTIYRVVAMNDSSRHGNLDAIMGIRERLLLLKKLETVDSTVLSKSHVMKDFKDMNIDLMPNIKCVKPKTPNYDQVGCDSNTLFLGFIADCICCNTIGGNSENFSELGLKVMELASEKSSLTVFLRQVINVLVERRDNITNNKAV